MKAERIRDLLRTVGPMTVSQLVRLMPEMSQGNLAKALGWMTHHTRNPNKRTHIKEWVYQDEIGRYYPRAVYAAGPGRNARKPVPQSHSVRQKLSRARRQVVVPNAPRAVWDLGRPR